MLQVQEVKLKDGPNEAPGEQGPYVVVVGAGPAGLTAAYELGKLAPGMRVLVLEADGEHVGGISRTESYLLDGAHVPEECRGHYRFDIGGHRFFSKSDAIMNLWQEILGEGFLHRPRLSRIHYKGMFFGYPLNLTEVIRNVGMTQSLMCGLSFFKAKLLPHRDPKTFHQWVANAFGERLFSIFFKTYTEKVWGMSCDEISADWAAQRIKGLSLSSAFFDAARRSLGLTKKARGGEVIKTLIDQFWYPTFGPGMMWEAARHKVEAAGNEVVMGARVVGLARSGHNAQRPWQVTYQLADGTRRSVEAAHVISSAPMREMVQALLPKVPDAVSRAASALRYRDYYTVAVMLKRATRFDDNWIYIHDPEVKVGRVQNYSSWSPFMVPNEFKCSCLGFEYFCNVTDDEWERPDQELAELAIKEGVALGLLDRCDVIGTRVVRQPKAYPVYTDDYKQNVEIIREGMKAYAGLHFVGRNGMHRYNNADHAMMTGMLVARNIVAGSARFDPWAVNEDAAYHEAVNADEAKALESLRLVPQRVTATGQA